MRRNKIASNRRIAKIGRKLHDSTEWLIFASRWIQAPIYLGLVFALSLYMVHFVSELYLLAKRALTEHLTEIDIMLATLTMVDAVLISNLLIIVIIGGWDTFVSRLYLAEEEDNPDWLSHVSAWVLKTKLATAIVSITAVHLLQSFIKSEQLDERTLIWQVVIHLVLLLSAIAVAVLAMMSHKQGVQKQMAFMRKKR